MKIQLIDGSFSAKDSVEIVTKMIEVKINYHENKIQSSSNEEDIKMRENKIKDLQNELVKLREYASLHDNHIISMHFEILI